jgi:hypothetical protein
MSFLTPWYLLGALAIVGPVLFHLIRRAARQRTTFSSLMFLRATPPRMTRRRKIEHLWLLILRCAALALLGAAFARPFLSRDVALPGHPAEGRQIVLLLDTSASMRRAGVWDKARAVAERYLNKAAPGDQVAVMTFSRQPSPAVNFAEWSSWSPDQRAGLARQRLAAISPGWMDTQLGLGLTTAAEQFDEDSAAGSTAMQREIVLISDLQEGAKLDGLQGHDWPAHVHVIVERIEAGPQSNAGLEIQGESGSAAQAVGETRVRVTNARDSSRESFQIGWEQAGAGALASATQIYLAPGQTRSFAAPTLPQGAATAALRLTGDEVDFDNVSYYAAPDVEPVAIAYFGYESANDPAKMRYYFQRVFPESPLRRIVLLAPGSNAPVSAGMLNQAMLAVIPRAVRPEEIAPLQDWLAGGRTALLVVADAGMRSTLESLTQWRDVRVTEGAGEFALLADIDFEHPLFAPFADPRYSDFAHIHFWKHRRLEIPADAKAAVLAKFDDGSPALVQAPVGKGNLLILAAGWQPADSQMAVSSKFPPLMETLLDWSGAGAPVRFQFLTGEAIPSPVASGEAVQWRKPDGKVESAPAGAAFTDTDTPGIYTAEFSGRKRRFAVNLSIEESRTAPMAPDELARLGVPMQPVEDAPEAVVRARELHLRRAELENRQKLWRWCLAGVLALCLGEILLGGWLTRRAEVST